MSGLFWAFNFGRNDAKKMERCGLARLCYTTCVWICENDGASLIAY